MEICMVHGHEVRELPVLPDSVTFLQIYHTSIERISAFPPGLKRLEIYKNDMLTELPTLPSSLEHLQLGHLPLKYIPDIPPSVKNVELYNLDVVELPRMEGGYIYLQSMKNLRYLPDPARVQISLIECPALHIKQTGSYDAFMDEWKQFHAMR